MEGSREFETPTPQLQASLQWRGKQRNSGQNEPDKHLRQVNRFQAEETVEYEAS